MIEHDDEALMRLLTSGDASAFQQLYRRHAPRTRGLAYHLLGDEQAAEDVVQEAFLSVWMRARQYDPARGTVEAWLNGIVRFACLNEYARRRRTPVVDAPLPEWRLAAANDVWLEAMRNVTADRLADELARLPAAQQRVIELAWMRGLTHVEIAERLGLPLGTVKGRLRLAMRALRIALLEDR